MIPAILVFYLFNVRVCYAGVLVCKSGLLHSPRSISCCAVGCLQAAIQPTFMKFCLELEEVVFEWDWETRFLIIFYVNTILALKG